jgi:hypothetical protein
MPNDFCDVLTMIKFTRPTIGIETVSATMRSPHDMNALPIDRDKLQGSELEGSIHEDNESTMEVSPARQQEMLELLQGQHPNKGLPPYFAPASFEYGENLSAESGTQPAKAPEEPSSYHVEYAPSPPEQLPADSDQVMIKVFKNENPALMEQLKQIGHRRRLRRGHMYPAGTPWNTPISRVRNKTITSSGKSPCSSTRNVSPQRKHQDEEVDSAEILCHEEVSLAIRLHVEKS